MSKKWELPRRTFLKGLATSIALPYLECMLPGIRRSEAWGATPPLRVIFCYKPNGEYPGSWEAGGATLPYVLNSLTGSRAELTFIKGLRNTSVQSVSDGHAPRVGAFLSGASILRDVSKVTGAKTIDHIIAEARGKKALVLAGPYEYSVANDNGFNGSAFTNLSYTGPNTAAKIKKPVDLFNSLTAANSAPTATQQQQAALKAKKKSILDFVQDDANAKLANLGKSDKLKMDEYLNSVREMEKVVDQIPTVLTQSCTNGMATPPGSVDFVTHTKLMMDMLFMSMQCGHSEVASYLLDIEVGGGYMNNHSNSHYTENGDSPTKRQAYQDGNRWYLSQFAYLVDKFRNSQDSNGQSMLANSLLIYGTGTGDGNIHEPANLAMVIAGRAQGALHPASGRVLVKTDQRLANLMLTVLKIAGVNQASLGDSNGTFTDL
jgi:hypothetical protein